MLPWIHISDFINYTESLFDRFLTAGGDKRVVDGEEKYRLVYSRAIREYLKKCAEGDTPKFTKNNTRLYLNRCRYYIYPERRIEEYTDTKGNGVDSPEEFSEKCVNLFFELSGVDFYFLRIIPVDENTDACYIEFRKEQQRCLEDLFETTVNYLRSSPKKEAQLTTFELKNFWELLYRKYRYQLSKKFLLKINMQHSLFLNEELVNWLSSVTNAYHEMRKLSGTVELDFDDEINYVDERDKEIQSLKDGYIKELKNLKILIQRIQIIRKAKRFTDVEKVIQKLIPETITTEFLEEIEKNPGKTYWKVYLTDGLIDSYYNNRNHSFVVSVLYMGNYKDAVKEYISICDAMWKIIAVINKRIEVVDYLISSKIFKLITEIDETFWFLKQQGNIAVD